MTKPVRDDRSTPLVGGGQMMPSQHEVLRASCVTLLARLATATSMNKGVSLHRHEVELAASAVSAYLRTLPPKVTDDE